MALLFRAGLINIKVRWLTLPGPRGIYFLLLTMITEGKMIKSAVVWLCCFFGVFLFWVYFELPCWFSFLHRVVFIAAIFSDLYCSDICFQCQFFGLYRYVTVLYCTVFICQWTKRNCLCIFLIVFCLTLWTSYTCK